MATVVVSARDEVVVALRRCGLSWSRIAGYTGVSRSGVRLVVSRAKVDAVPALENVEPMLQRPDESPGHYSERLSGMLVDGCGCDLTSPRVLALWAALCKFHGADALADMRADRILHGEWYG